MGKISTDIFKKLFVHRDDVYAIQQTKGSYIPVKEPIDEDIIEAHLTGRQTIGLYQVKPEENTIKWACLDIDLTKSVWSSESFNIEDWKDKLLEQAEISKKLLSNKGIPSYIEFSGNKGYHVWVFFENPVPSSIIKSGFESIFSNMRPTANGIEWEIFPKQTQVNKGSFGNLVKGPNGYHHKSKVFSEFIDNLSVSTIDYADTMSFSNESAPYTEPLKKCEALQNMWDTCLEQEESPNFFNEIVGYMFTNMGKEAERYATQNFFSRMKNYDSELTKKNIGVMKTKMREEGEGYLPITCEKLQDGKYGSICSQKCSAIGRAKSPIAFYHWSTQEKEVDINALDKSDFLFQRGNSYYERLPGKEDTKIKKLSSFTMDITKDTTISTGMPEYDKRLFEGVIKKKKDDIDFEISSDDFSNDEKLKAFIYKALGPNKLLIDNIQSIKTAIQKYADAEPVFILKQFGFNDLKGSDKYPYKYMSPSVIVDKDGIRSNDDTLVSLEGEEFAECLDLQKIDDETFIALKKHIQEDLIKVVNEEVTYGALSFTFLPILFPFLEGDRTKFTYFVRGESGTGKSYTMQAFQNFYGEFDSVPTWSSTANSLGRIGYFMKDSLFMIDDFKKRMFNKPGAFDGALTLMQNYADNTARSRMNANMELAKTFVVKGWLASTGEDTPSGEASNLARLIPVTCNTKYKDMVRGKRIQEMKKFYPGFTARYMHHLFNVAPVLLNKVMQDNMDHFYKKVGGQSNDIRIARNVSLLATSFKFISDFLWSKKKAIEAQETFMRILDVQIMDVASEAAEELASDRFLKGLQELMSSNKVRMLPNYMEDVEENNHTPIIGYWGSHKETKEPVGYLVVNLAFKEIQSFLRASNESLTHTKKAIIHELYENGMIYNKTVQSRKMRGRSVRVIIVKPGYL